MEKTAIQAAKWDPTGVLGLTLTLCKSEVKGNIRYNNKIGNREYGWPIQGPLLKELRKFSELMRQALGVTSTEVTVICTGYKKVEGDQPGYILTGTLSCDYSGEGVVKSVGLSTPTISDCELSEAIYELILKAEKEFTGYTDTKKKIDMKELMSTLNMQGKFKAEPTQEQIESMTDEERLQYCKDFMEKRGHFVISTEDAAEPA